MNLYTPTLRPAGFQTLPPGLKWDYVEAPNAAFLASIHMRRPELPLSQHFFGVISTERPLIQEELEAYELRVFQPTAGNAV